MTNQQVYAKYTAKDKFNQRIDREITCYIIAAKFLNQHGVLNSIGYDQDSIENFLFFWSDSYKDFYEYPD